MNTHRHKKDFILFRPNAILCVFLLPLLVSTSAFAEDIVYEGGELQKNPLPSSSGLALFSSNSLSGNTVTNNATVNGIVFGGVTAGNETVSGNLVNVHANVSGSVYGGYSKLGNAENNSIFVKNAQIAEGQNIVGGFVEGEGSVIANHVELKNSTAGDVYGGGAYHNGSAIANSVIINNGTGEKITNVYAGFHRDGGTGNVINNRLIINGGNITEAAAGYTQSGTGIMQGNYAEMNSGTITDSLYGASGDMGHVIDNHVTINGGSVGNVYGGWVYGGASASHNGIIINNGTVTGSVYGGYSLSGTNENTVSGNTVDIHGGTLKGVYGGYVKNGNVEVSGNQVRMTAGTVKDVYGGYAASGNAMNNSVVIAGGNVQGSVYGGYGQAGTSDSRVSNNIVEINADVSGAVYGGFVKTGTVSGNRVTVAGGTVHDVYGGEAIAGSAIGNSIFITGGKVTGNIVGGKGSGEVSGNTITIGKDADVSEATISGGEVITTTTRMARTAATGGGNTLNVVGYQGSAVNINNISTINFVVGNTIDSSKPLLTLTESTGTDMSGVTINQVSMAGGSNVAGVGSSINLIANSNGLINADVSNIAAKRIRQGLGLWHDITPEATANGLSARITGTSVDPSLGIFNTSRLATVEFLNQGTDVVLGYGLEKATASVEAGKGFGVFGAVSGSDVRNNVSGGSAKASGSHFLIGAAAKLNQGKDADVLAGGFVQAGWGDVEGHNRWTQGRGDTNYYGLGLLAKYSQKAGAAKGLYGQAYAQLGHAKTTFNSDLYDGEGNRGKLDKGSMYYGAGLGVGYLKEIAADFSVDLSAQYKWLHLDEADTRIVGDTYRFDAIDSHRTKLGARLNYTANKQFTPYVGLAWEYEFSGKAKGNMHGYKLDDASMKGSTGVAELGISFNPSLNSPWSFDVNVQAYAGQREGVQGHFMVGYRF